MRETFARLAMDVDGRPVCATVSIGIVHCEEPALDVAELLAQADQALYFAKESGRNRVEVASLEMILERQGNEKVSSATSVAGMVAKSAA
jgi:predicted signal transduction protein with EAL and GGDEF domain